MKSARTWWIIYAACAAAVLLALTWVTTVVLRLEHYELESRVEAEFSEPVRLALWRMDSWLAPQIAREAARPHYEYEPFYKQDLAYTKVLRKIQPGEVLAPSPLLGYRSDIFRLHFQTQGDGIFTSPQVPQGNQRDIAESSGVVDPVHFDSCVSLLETLPDRVPITPELTQQFVCAVQSTEQVANDEPPLVATLTNDIDKAKAQQAARSRVEARSRAGSANVAQQAQQLSNSNYQWTDPGLSIPMPPTDQGIEIGPLVPVWTELASIDTGLTDGSDLVLLREVRTGTDMTYQGILCDWPALRAALLDKISDLLPDATLVPVSVTQLGNDPTGRTLATVPVALDVQRPVLAATPFLTSARGALLISWLAVLAAIGAAGITLRASVVYGETRSRFASAVTHELRTPLTTFRMYSEMLADGMVRDESQRRAYLETLKDESNRLSALVENVLAYARLEEGRAGSQAEHTTVGALLERLLPSLSRRVEAAGMTLQVDPDADGQPIVADVSAVGQILFNLIDNACKYAIGSDPARIDVDVEIQAEHVIFRVSDYGAGVPAASCDAIFTAFDRGNRDETDEVPGVGLGLALSRGLAREMGGDLCLNRAHKCGACFELRLPANGPTRR